MIIDILTIFPDLLTSPLQEGIIRRAREEGKIEVAITNIRAFATDRHAMTDDRPFGGGEGMVMKPEPLAAAVDHVRSSRGKGRVTLLTPQGRTFTQKMAATLAREPHLILVCGRYEGVDQRFCDQYVEDEISIGDFILTGGELAAMVVIDAVTRLLPDVLGCAESASKDTFSRSLLKHPQYTRPREWQGMAVPAELISGDHQAIHDFRFIASVARTLERRPELLVQATFSEAEKRLLQHHRLYDTIEQVRAGLSRDKK